MLTNVLLIPSHRPLDTKEPGIKYERALSINSGVELTEDHLAGPLFGCHHGHALKEGPSNQIYRNCLRALLNLGPFTSIVSVKARWDTEGLELTRRDWAHIYYQGRAVAEFTHYTTGLHGPYSALLEWAELVDDSVMFEWSIDRWREFFLERIRDTMRLQHEKATALVEENQATIAFAESVFETLLVPA